MRPKRNYSVQMQNIMRVFKNRDREAGGNEWSLIKAAQYIVDI